MKASNHLLLAGAVVLGVVLGSLGATGQEIIDFKTAGVHRALVLETTSHTLFRVGALGDIDGDGFADVLLGMQTQKGQDTGRQSITDVVFGAHVTPGRTLLETAPFARMRILHPDSSAFSDTARLGDFDGDGVDDCLVGIPIQVPGYSEGVAYLLYGRREVRRPSLSLGDIGDSVRGCRFTSSDLSHASVGQQVEAIGDFNGDGIDDLAISAPWPAAPEERPPDMDPRGQLFIVFGGGDLVGAIDLKGIQEQGRGILVEGSNQVRGVNDAAPFAENMSRLGDVNGDGLHDCAVWDSLDGYILLGHRSTGGTIDLRDIIEGATYDHVILVKRPSNIGLSLGGLTGLGDITGDGRAELAIGLVRASISGIGGAGKVHLIHGREEFTSVIDTNLIPLPEANVTIGALRIPDAFGGTIIACGDINHDGRDDLGMRGRGDNREGEFAVLYGSQGLSDEIRLDEAYHGIFIVGEAGGDELASGYRQVAACGDFSGDGIDDLVMLASHPFPLNNTYPERLYIVLGEDASAAGLRVYVVTPATGVQRGGTRVSVRGSRFSDDTIVLFDGHALESATVVSELEIRGLTPPRGAIGKVAVEVRRGGDVATLTNGFEYTANVPDYDVRDLGRGGVILEGETGVSGSKAFTFQSGSAISFGDLDGDGIDDLAVESTAFDGWFCTLVRGRPGLEGTFPAYQPGPDVVLLRESDVHFGSTGRAGCYLSRLGDVNDDGYQDLGIGTWGGVAFVLFGRGDLLGGEDIVLGREMESGGASRIDLGGGVAGQTILCGLSDLDGNGIDEFAIGHSADGGQIRIIEVGDAWTELMGDLGPWTKATLWSGDLEIRIGQQLFNVGDFNGDSINDLLVRSEVRNMRFVAFVVYGAREFPESAEISEWVADGGGVKIVVSDGFEQLPFAQVARAGDVNGDGYKDVLIGIDGGGDIVTQGATYVFFGGSDLPVEVEVAEGMPLPEGFIQVLGEGKTEQAGRVGPAGDFNDDGYDDFLIGGPGFQSLDESGNVFLIYGAETLPRRIELRDLGGMGLKFDGQNVPGGAGFVVGPSGDLNADGQDDFVFSEIGNPEQIARVYVIYGPFGSKDFSRGDANADGLLDLTDAIGVLNFLFSGGRPPLCMDAADADDDGTVTITDPIRVLNYLFLGADPPLPPFPGLGPDPSEDDVDCLLF